MNRIVTMASGSTSSLYGAIATSIMNIIQNKFPKDYFKYTNLSTELSSRNIRRQFGTNSSKEITKREKPYLIVQPTFATFNTGDVMQNIPMTANFDNLQYSVDKRVLFPIVRDRENAFGLKFKMNRDKIEFDVTVTVSTLHQQLDIHRSLRNTIFWDRANNVRMALESVIPKGLVELMGAYCNMDIINEPSYIPALTRRLNACSGYPITYKMRTANYSDEWYMYYKHNVIVSFTDLEMDSGSMKNMAPDSYRINFRVSAEFNMPGLFLIDSEKPALPGQIDGFLIAKSHDEDPSAIIPIFTLYNLYNRYPQELDGMQLYGTTIITTESDDDGKDFVDFSTVLEEDYIRVITSHQKYYTGPSSLIRIIILKNDVELKEGTDYHIDWMTLAFKINDADNSATYRLIIYFNLEMVNEILSNTEYEKVLDISKLNTTEFGDGMNTENVIINNDNFNNYIEDSFISDTMYLRDKVPEGSDPTKTEVINPSDGINNLAPDGVELSDFRIVIEKPDGDIVSVEDRNYKLAQDADPESEELESGLVYPSTKISTANDPDRKIPPGIEIASGGIGNSIRDEIVQDENIVLGTSEEADTEGKITIYSSDTKEIPTTKKYQVIVKGEE